MSTAVGVKKNQLISDARKLKRLAHDSELSREKLLAGLEELIHREVNLTVEEALGNYSVDIEYRAARSDGREEDWEPKPAPRLANGISFDCIVKRVGINSDGCPYLVFFVIPSTELGNGLMISYCEEYRIWLVDISNILLTSVVEE